MLNFKSLNYRLWRTYSSQTSREKRRLFLKQREADEERGVFRVLDIGLPKKIDSERRELRKEFRVQNRKQPDVEWSSVWPAPKTFHPYVVPLPIRQGYVKPKEIVPDKHANVELMKIPNFLHATPPAIRQHCAAIRKFCTEWPKELDSEDVINASYPVTKITSDYLNASSSLRDFRARVVTFKFNLSSLFLGPRAEDKMIRLLGPDKYDMESDEVTIVVDRCPYRKQNSDYFNYVISALFFESSKIESWETDGKTFYDLERFDYDRLFDEEENVSIDRIRDSSAKESFDRVINEGENENTLSMLKEDIIKKHYQLEAF